MPILVTGLTIAGVVAKKRSPTAPPDFGPTFTVDQGGSFSALPILLVLGFALVAGLIVYLSYAAKKRRRMGFIQMAAQQHLTYSEQDPFGLLGYPFSIFQRGDGRGIEHVVHGMWQEINVVGFDYWYYQESTDSKGGTSRTYYRFDCVLVPVQAACSRLTIERENFLTRMADVLSFDDIQFESEQFNDTFNVKAEDKKFANDLIDARMMQWLLAGGSDYAFEVLGNRAMIVGPKIDPAAFPQLLGVARGFVDHVPRVVYSLYPG
ncbi:MAG TPA: hypothetical protein VJM84_00225 [Actinomycetota bacterium]|nr:hypothetical protein [Actinomycetota bacterium]